MLFKVSLLDQGGPLARAARAGGPWPPPAPVSAPLSGAPVPLSAPPRTSTPPGAVSTWNSSHGAPADRSRCADAAARPGPRSQPASHRGAATQSGLHGQPSADCGRRRCARSNGQRGGEGCPAGGMPIVSPGPMWPAAVLPPSRIRAREQTELPGCGWRGAAAAAQWLRPPWSLRVGTRIAVADQRVVNALGTATTEPATSHLPRTRHHPFPAPELTWKWAASRRVRQPPRYHRHRGPDHGLPTGLPLGLPGF
ncbi:hypothetical protein BJY27_004860 [Streptomyces rapamycinicus]|uniref:Uncharacterized protein n=2 Tax=Streptomyces rapamycinicus TaxID=1226757 RepID=A0A3L8RLK1_STRRN|nr:hypothetical protein [Streptomyces rapamycinicus]RLV80611.1 hypothetical protein D3C57_119540 [Streptomyces rapamycinicus NRRL 5491]